MGTITALLYILYIARTQRMYFALLNSKQSAVNMWKNSK